MNTGSSINASYWAFSDGVRKPFFDNCSMRSNRANDSTLSLAFALSKFKKCWKAYHKNCIVSWFSLSLADLACGALGSSRTSPNISLISLSAFVSKRLSAADILSLTTACIRLYCNASRVNSCLLRLGDKNSLYLRKAVLFLSGKVKITSRAYTLSFFS